MDTGRFGCKNVIQVGITRLRGSMRAIGRSCGQSATVARRCGTARSELRSRPPSRESSASQTGGPGLMAPMKYSSPSILFMWYGLKSPTTNSGAPEFQAYSSPGEVALGPGNAHGRRGTPRCASSASLQVALRWRSGSPATLLARLGNSILADARRSRSHYGWRNHERPKQLRIPCVPWTVIPRNSPIGSSTKAARISSARPAARVRSSRIHSDI